MSTSSERPESPSATEGLDLRYFEDVLPVEFDAIKARRSAINKRGDGNERKVEIAPLGPVDRPASSVKTESRAVPPRLRPDRLLSPDPGRLFGRGTRLDLAPDIDVDRPDRYKTRPRPVPCTVNGLAFSGGGIRSAAVALGGLQAFHAHEALLSVDYLSTVSGGGYIGASLSAGMSRQGGGIFPFGEDVADNWAVAHLRNYSNYLLPRGRGTVRNMAEFAAVALRGLLANVVVVFAAISGAALLTKLVFPDAKSLDEGSFLENMHLVFWLAVALGLVLAAWAMLRSLSRLDGLTGDTQSPFLTIARNGLVATAIVLLIELQPVVIRALPHAMNFFMAWWHFLAPVVAALPPITSFFSATLGRFLKATQRTSNWGAIVLRGLAMLLVVTSSLVVPAGVWVCYLLLARFLITGPDTLSIGPVAGLSFINACIVAFCATALMSALVKPNGYSLHRFYRDRLSKAFIFADPRARSTATIAGSNPADPPWLDKLKLSQLRGGEGPYHIINAALNVQGSEEANRRGRGADFFMFTQDFIGSDLTHYALTSQLNSSSSPGLAATSMMERKDPRLDVATAMAVSGAAISANMGGNTIRLMSPTLALLNVRLGYWLRNPRDLARKARPQSFRAMLARRYRQLKSSLYLLSEMLNLLDENLPYVYLTDGGHIENLGAYELLKRGCQLIFVIDAESDPTMSFGSLMTLERYARIDLGIRIALPWQTIATTTLRVKQGRWSLPGGFNGPHCAVGKIFYENGAEGTIVYFKSSITGDEKDYVLDYMKRYPAFPHETTGDQFFTEEQFEAYRALGFHMVDRFFNDSDDAAFLPLAEGGFADRNAALQAVLSRMETVR